jgi:Tfp pilus assembly protein PilV
MRARLGNQDGFAMFYVLAVLVIAIGFGAAALAETLDSRNLTTRDGRVRRAQQASDAGVRRILYQQAESNIDNWNLNGGPLGLSTVLDCLPMTLNASAQISGLTTASVNAAGVCPQTSGSNSSTYTEPLGNHAYEQAEFIPGQTNFLGGAERIHYPKIVSLGWDDNGTNKVYARQEVILAPIAPLQAVEGMNNVTINGLSALGLNTAVAVNGDLSARGTLTLPSVYAGVNLSTTSGSLQATVAAPTISGSVVSTVNGGTVSQSQIVQRPTITISSSKSDCPSGGCPSVSNAVGSDGYNSTSHAFTMTSASESVTFQPGD